MWFHVGLKSKKIKWNSEHTKYLRKVHNISTVGDMLHITKMLNVDINPNHKPCKNCACDMCKRYRLNGCINSHKCAQLAEELLSKLDEKWNLRSEQQNRVLTEEELAISQMEETQVFNPEISTKDSLEKGFRIFTEVSTSQDTGSRDYSRSGASSPNKITMYTNGSCLKNISVEAEAGAGIWFSQDDQRNLAIRLPSDLPQSNNMGEAVAILVAVQTMPSNCILHIKSNSQIILDTITKNLSKREDDGWISTANKLVLKALVANLWQKQRITLLEKVRGHASILENKGADKLANEGVNKTVENKINLTISEKYKVSGTKLANLTQSTAYKGLVETSATPYRKGTTIHQSGHIQGQYFHA